MGEVPDLTPKLITHWEKHLDHCDKGREQALRQLSRLTLYVSGQLELPLHEALDQPPDTAA